MKTEKSGLPHVVIVGAGFGGLQAAKRLRKERVNLTIIDRRNHHLFQPLLYQVATAELSPSNIAVPIRPMFRDDVNVRVILSEVESVTPARRQLRLKNGDEIDAFCLLQQRHDGDHRSKLSGGRSPVRALQRLPCMAGLAFPPHHVSRRLPEPGDYIL